MRIHPKLRHVASTALMLLLFAPAAFAQSAPSGGNGLGKILRNLTGVSNDAILFLQVFSIVCGIGLIIGGIFALVKDAKSQGNGPVSKGAAAIMIVAGGVLSFVTLLIDTTGETVWGDTSGGRDRITIPQ
jgi:type IV secretory pathway VirB2 component (pilin)